MFARLGSIAIIIFAAVGVILGSFWSTLKILDQIDSAKRGTDNTAAETIDDVQLTNWMTFGKASYEVRGDSVVMRGPDYIFSEIDCKPDIEAEFSIFLDRAAVANMQLAFLNIRGTAISQSSIQDISGMSEKIAKLRAVAPIGTRKVRVLIYSPQPGDSVIFRNPIVRLHSRFKS